MSDIHQTSSKRSIRRTLQLWLLAGATICTVVTGLMTYTVMRDEANELFDRQLRQLVLTVPHDLAISPLKIPGEETEDDIVVQVWSDTGKSVYTAPTEDVLPRSTSVGFSEITFHHQRWRVYAQVQKGYHVQAAQPTETRDELAGQMALGATTPFLLLIPALLILIWLVIRRSLLPLIQVTQAVANRSLDSLRPIDVVNIPNEIRPLLYALNDLLSRLEQAWSAQRTFVADAAHELRSPLTALKLQLQRAEKTTDEEQRSIAYHKLHERLDRTTHVVQQLLTLARQEPQGKTQPESAIADLITVAQSAVADFGPMAEDKNIELVLQSHCNTAPLTIATDTLRILLDNVIDNAIRYTPQGGHVTVSIDTDKGQSELVVMDTGPGIPIEERERVFDRFYRREDSGEIGSGLGLAIVKTIANRYHAAVSLEEANGGGTLLRVNFHKARLSE